LQVNADEFKDIANIYKVRTAPTILFIYHSNIYESHQGFIDVEELEEIINRIPKE